MYNGSSEIVPNENLILNFLATIRFVKKKKVIITKMFKNAFSD